MTERAGQDPAASPGSKARPRPAPQRGPRPPSGIVVPAIALAIFFGTFTVMSLRMGAGQDPALGTGDADATAAADPRGVVVRRIVRRTVILPPREQPVAAGGAAPAAPPGVAPEPTGGTPAPAPVSSGGAPSPAAAPAPTPAAPPAPSPAPAPTTRAS